MSIRILVADDSRMMRNIIIRSLNSLGITEVVEAENGSQAVELFQPGAFALVLTDWNMPVKSGLEAAREIRALDNTVPIIMITTESEKRSVLSAIQAGVTDYLVKPFSPDALREKVEVRIPALA